MDSQATIPTPVSPAPDNAAATAPRKLTVLVIEDDTLTRITLCKIFAKMNYTPIEACNGFMGIKMHKQHKPDIIVTDLVMPDKEGLQTISEIRAIDSQVRIVAISAGGNGENALPLKMAKKMGADFTLGKPFKPVEILELLQNLQHKRS